VVIESSVIVIVPESRWLLATIGSMANGLGTRGRLLVTGASGYLGRAVIAAAHARGWEVHGTRLTAASGGVPLDVRQAPAVDRLVEQVRPDAVVHTAYLQSGPTMRAVNVDGSGNVAVAARRVGARLIHVSTDFVFDGRQARPYREDDRPAPLTDYGHSKLDGERAVAGCHPEALVVRTSLIYGGSVPGPQERMVYDAIAGAPATAFFEDEIRCPIAAPDLAAGLVGLAESSEHGILHLAGPDVLSRLEFARLLATAAGGDPGVLRSARSADVSPDRPLDCSLDSSRAYLLLGAPVRGVRDALGLVEPTAL
jgi:dTDP-4-dehydrorhamnose reductase